MTSPASGSPASSSRARSSAWPRRVDGAVVLQVAGAPSRSADDEKRKKRRTNVCDSAVEQRRVRAVQLLLDERAARLAVAVGDRHAARVVDQDAEEVLLRDRRLQDQRRPEQAEEQDRQRREPQADEHDAVARAIGGRNAAIGQQREDGERRHRRDDEQDGAGQTPGEIALLKQAGAGT